MMPIENFLGHFVKTKRYLCIGHNVNIPAGTGTIFFVKSFTFRPDLYQGYVILDIVTPDLQENVLHFGVVSDVIGALEIID